MNLLLTASLGQQWEVVINGDERPEMVICVLRCQSGAVNVIVTDRAVWCVRNFTLQGVQQATTASSGSSKSFVSFQIGPFSLASNEDVFQPICFRPHETSAN